MTKDENKKIIIEGVTTEGKTFRPSNWAERMSGQLSTFKKRKIKYSPMLQPSIRDGNHCVVLDPKLKESNPQLYSSILTFAEKNTLRICKSDDDEPNDDK